MRTKQCPCSSDLSHDVISQPPGIQKRRATTDATQEGLKLFGVGSECNLLGRSRRGCIGKRCLRARQLSLQDIPYFGNEPSMTRVYEHLNY